MHILCAIKEDKSMDCHVIKEGKKATQKRTIGKSPKIFSQTKLATRITKRGKSNN
jgi:hypothetical protein